MSLPLDDSLIMMMSLQKMCHSSSIVVSAFRAVSVSVGFRIFSIASSSNTDEIRTRDR